MNSELEKYRNMRICVAVSGGKDSMALLHYLHVHGGEYGITLSALNCDHGIWGEASARDSAFVKKWCEERSIPLLMFKWNAPPSVSKTEENARFWRVFQCYEVATRPNAEWEGEVIPEIFTDDGTWQGVDAVATAHHLNDNAETVLFNLARGCGLSGASGICDSMKGYEWDTIHPLIGCTREEIDEYIAVNNIPYVDDESNFTDDYTCNKIRHTVLPELEKAVPGAAKAIYRFSRLAAEDEEYLSRQAKKLVVSCPPYGEGILLCEERVIFKRAALDIVNGYQLKDYTSEHAERLYRLQFAENGKKFEFLGLTAFKEEGKVVIVSDMFLSWQNDGMPFPLAEKRVADNYCGQFFWVIYEQYLEEDMKHVRDYRETTAAKLEDIKLLKFDIDAVPDNAVVRFMREGDRFEKFGGGTKKLGDYFTDKKIPVRVRRTVPLVAVGSDILAVGGLEISDKIKVTQNTKQVGYIVCADYSKY